MHEIHINIRHKVVRKTEKRKVLMVKVETQFS
jgi:hypothetical protein